MASEGCAYFEGKNWQPKPDTIAINQQDADEAGDVSVDSISGPWHPWVFMPKHLQEYWQKYSEAQSAKETQMQWYTVMAYGLDEDGKRDSSVLEPKSVLAKSAENAKLKTAQSELKDKDVDRVEIVVVPIGG
jgi:hypothetical protein